MEYIDIKKRLKFGGCPRGEFLCCADLEELQAQKNRQALDDSRQRTKTAGQPERKNIRHIFNQQIQIFQICSSLLFRGLRRKAHT